MALLALAAATGCDDAQPMLLHTPDWVLGARTQTQVRNLGEHGLLLRKPGSAVYAWHVGVRSSLQSLQQVDEAAWHAASSAVFDCQEQLPAVEVRSEGEGKASLRGKPLKLAGSHFGNADRSKDARWAAINSASGERWTVMRFLGGGHSPPFYLQFLDVTTGQFYPKVWKLPFSGSVAALRVCWTADDRYVLIQDLVRSGLVILPTPLKEPTP